METAFKDFKLFDPLTEDDLSQPCYAAFLRVVAQYREEQLFEDTADAFDIKQSNNPLDDEIHCMNESRDELDCFKALLTMSKQDFDGGMGSQFGVEKTQGRKFEERPMAVADALIAFQVGTYKEICLSVLNDHILQLMEDDHERYNLLGSHLCGSSHFFYNLLQEIRDVHLEFASGNLSLRTGSKTLNILILLQCMASSKDTWGAFIKALTPNCLKPLILTNDTDDHYEAIRMASLSIIFMICQNPDAANWALNNDVILICQHSMQAGSFSSKLIALLILESILKSEKGISNFCNQTSTHLEMVVETFANLVTLVATAWDFSPCLLAPIIRCYLLLAKYRRPRELLKTVLPSELQSDRFKAVLKGMPETEKLWQLLLFILEKTSVAMGSSFPA
ncbi:hypothetical protein L7F22_036821 [Adiantum nelumboides]|nr:hypothetical protein [Adiantum nelumboides]